MIKLFFYATPRNDHKISKYMVRYGTLDRRAGHDLAIIRITLHPAYTPFLYDNDLAMITVNTSFTTGTNAKTIEIG